MQAAITLSFAMIVISIAVAGTINRIRTRRIIKRQMFALVAFLVSYYFAVYGFHLVPLSIILRGW